MAQQPVIVVTDGDETAFHAIEAAAKSLRLKVLRQSHGNPTPLSGRELVERAREVGGGEPIVVMVDDQGEARLGKGEKALAGVLASEELRVLGVVAVAAHTRGVRGVVANVSVTGEGNVTPGAVDKDGDPSGGTVLKGDTVDVLRDYPGVYVVGLGDPGKMEGEDAISRGAPATAHAIREVLERSGYHESRVGG